MAVEFQQYTNFLVDAGLYRPNPTVPNQPSTTAFYLRTLENVPQKILDHLVGTNFDYFETLEQQKIHLIASENLANAINAAILTHPICAELRQRVEEDGPHGIGHLRRNEKIVKHIDAKDRALRADSGYRYFAFCGYMANRMHDLVQAWTHSKNGHDEGAALFALGTLSQIQTPLPQDIWDDLTWGTAYVCKYHSYPEKMPKIEELIANGFLDPQELLNDVKRAAEKKGKDIYSFFPPFNLIKDYIESIEREEIHPPYFSQEKIAALNKRAMVFIAADKLDSLYPVDLSSGRTVLTNVYRPLWMPIGEQVLSIHEEFEARRRRSDGRESECDLDRYIYELTRMEKFHAISPVVNTLFRQGLRQKAIFLRNAIDKFYQGDFYPFTYVYEKMLREMIDGMLIQAEVDGKDRIKILRYEPLLRLQYAQNEIGKKNPELIKSFNYLHFIYTKEQTNLQDALRLKHQGLVVGLGGISALEPIHQRSLILFDEVTQWQNKNIPSYGVELKPKTSIVTPYFPPVGSGSYWINNPHNPEQYGILFRSNN